MSADGAEIFFGKRNMDMASVCTDSSVQDDNLAVFIDQADIYTAGITDPAARNAADTAEHNTGADISDSTEGFNGLHQILSSRQADAMADQVTTACNDSMLHGTPSFFCNFTKAAAKRQRKSSPDGELFFDAEPGVA
jgi:hypothetical protein